MSFTPIGKCIRYTEYEISPKKSKNLFPLPLYNRINETVNNTEIEAATE